MYKELIQHYSSYTAGELLSELALIVELMKDNKKVDQRCMRIAIINEGLV